VLILPIDQLKNLNYATIYHHTNCFTVPAWFGDFIYFSVFDCKPILQTKNIYDNGNLKKLRFLFQDIRRMVLLLSSDLSVTRISIKFIRCSNHSRFIQKRQSLLNILPIKVIEVSFEKAQNRKL
jgi:hypothetical protein